MVGITRKTFNTEEVSMNMKKHIFILTLLLACTSLLSVHTPLWLDSCKPIPREIVFYGQNCNNNQKTNNMQQDLKLNPIAINRLNKLNQHVTGKK